MNINIELPFFPGFYESWAYNSNTSYFEDYQYIEDMKETFGVELESEIDFNFDFEGFKKEFCEAFISVWNTIKPECVKTIHTEGFQVISPAYYNYSTDRLFVDIELEDNWLESMLQFIENNREWFANRIKEEWSDRPGFWSFMVNTVDEWTEKLSAGDKLYIETTLGYMALKADHTENGFRDNLIMDVYEKLDYSSHYYLTEFGKSKINK